MASLGGLATKLFGSSNERRIRRLHPLVDQINGLEDGIAALSDDELKAKTDEFRQRLKDGESVDDILPEVFAVVREASKRVLGLRPFDVQLMGAKVLHEGAIAEMRTGEGKTLVATLPVYLNALEGKGVHVVTVNDYLASRDAENMGRIYSFLGMTTGVIMHGMNDDQRREAYGCDITYGTNNELGFDYLRDNMKYERDQMVQRGHNYAIVDEVDSILIDEARTPLIISGPLDDRSDMYVKVDKLIPNLTEEDYEVDEKQRTATFTEEGTEKMENLLRDAGLMQGNGLYDIENVALVHHANNALRAHRLFTRDKDYIVNGGDIVIVDEFTGRQMPGRRFSEGLHQALEAKEGVDIQPENQTLASITFQNYFRMYDKLAGMTGTAVTEAEEFGNIYGLDVVEVPTNLPVIRADEDDEVYRTAEEKFAAIVEEIKAAKAKEQPILVGTTSIEKSEYLAERLRQDGLKDFEILNARQHEREAFIVAQAGVPGSITIATNMAGRGTDIQLGGNLEMRLAEELGELEGDERKQAEQRIRDEVAGLKKKAIEAGGLYVLATERHESRRIDNQLRGRSGRQGDPGRSKFYLSLQDDLMRIFGSERMDGMLQKLGLQEGEAIIHPWINKALEKAQKKVEARNFDIRKNLLKYDDVMNDQRKVVFEQRLELMDGEDLTETVEEMREEVVDDMVRRHIPENAYAESWDIPGLKGEADEALNLQLPIEEWVEEEGIAEDDIRERILAAAKAAADERANRFGPDVRTYVEKSILLQTLDHLWREHLVNLDHLRSVIGFRGYAQRDPLQEYKGEAFELFQAMLNNLRRMTTQQLMRIQIRATEEMEQPQGDGVPEGAHPHHLDMMTGEDDAGDGDDEGLRWSDAHAVSATGQDTSDPDSWGKVGRNEPCPCGSGKKFKHCHGAFV